MLEISKIFEVATILKLQEGKHSLSEQKYINSCKIIEVIAKTQMEILRLKNLISKIKRSLNGLIAKWK